MTKETVTRKEAIQCLRCAADTCADSGLKSEIEYLLNLVLYHNKKCVAFPAGRFATWFLNVLVLCGMNIETRNGIITFTLPDN